MPTSATGWKYDPSGPAGSRPSASNWAAMYFAASRPPRVAGARPSSRSSARYLRCASMAGVLTAGMGASSVAGVAVDPDAPAQPNEIIAAANAHLNDTSGSSSMGSLGAYHGVNRHAAAPVGFDGENERRVVQEIVLLFLHIAPR